MEEIDQFSNNLLEEAKYFFCKSKQLKGSERNAYLHSSILIGFAALESYLNSIVLDFSTRNEFNVLEKSLMFQKDVVFEKGDFQLTNGLKMHRLEDRISFLFKRFSGKCLTGNDSHWMSLKEGISIRNKLTHPKEKQNVTTKSVEKVLLGIIHVLDKLYKAIYKKNFPKVTLGTETVM